MVKQKVLVKSDDKLDYKCKWHHHHGGSGGAGYFLGFIGAAVYFIGQATTFWMGALGVFKAIIWPAYLVYYALKYFGI